MDILKIRDVKTPSRGTAGSAGVDFYVPEYGDEFLFALFSKNRAAFYRAMLEVLPIEDFEAAVSYASGDMQSAALVYLRKLVKTDDDGKKYLEIPAGLDLCVPSGVKTKFDDGAFIAFNKSGVATKQKFVMGACVIDKDYQGELHVHVINTSDYRQRVTFGGKLSQFIHVPVLFDDIADKTGASEKDFFDAVSERGAGAFGSTGN